MGRISMTLLHKRAVRILLHRSSGIAIAAVVSLALIGVGVSLPENARRAFIAEDGPVEDLAVIAYAVLFLAFLAISKRNRSFLVASATVVALMAARELDLHKAFASGSIIKLRTYTSDTVPFGEKLIAGAFVIAVASFLIWYAVRYGPWLWRAARSGYSAAYSTLAGAILLATAKILDAFARTLRDVTGIEIHTGTALQLIEEVFETTAPLVFLWAILVGYWISPARHGSPDRSHLDG